MKKILTLRTAHVRNECVITQSRWIVSIQDQTKMDTNYSIGTISIMIKKKQYQMVFIRNYNNVQYLPLRKQK